MGDGGVACMPLQQPQQFRESYAIAEKANSGGQNGIAFNSKSFKFANTERKHEMKGAVGKSELGLKEAGKGGSGNEDGGICAQKLQKEEVEEGELGILKWSKGEVENGEFFPENSGKSEIEKGEFVSGKWLIEVVGNGGMAPGERRSRESEKGEFGSWRSTKDDMEKGNLFRLQVIEEKVARSIMVMADCECASRVRTSAREDIVNLLGLL